MNFDLFFLDLINLNVSLYIKNEFEKEKCKFWYYNQFQDKRYREDLCVVLKLPWTHMLPAVDNDCPWKAKCLSLQVLSKLGPNLSSSVVLEVLDMGLHDEAEKVRTEAVISMPVMHFWSTLDISSPVIQKIEYIKRDNEKVKKLVLITLGLLSCLYGCRGATSGLHTDECLYGEIIVVFSNHVGDYFGVWFLLSILVPRMISKRTIDGAAIQCDTSLMIVTKNGDLKIAFVEV